ncbi:MAG: chromosome segregation protein SMC [Nitrospirae bacterium]|nr:chromosome segregation protein SMC [Nitrospirota bacterium]
MRVEKIELIGFKSFSDKTVLDFHPGITAIVGPNGCGKSNVVDAVKWVLGEQSAKSLRGKHMEDVIFTGSASKKPKGMAEVTLVISGVSNGSSPNAAAQISVTRRLYRSGESEYLMNKVQCRLKDIKDVLLDTGLEVKTYSILEQGRMDEIILSKPEDRRFLIEEVAGVMKYKVRRAEAIHKLESAQQNLQRLQDIITEVKRQINSIDRHAKKAERYKKLFEEIKGIELRVANRDVNSLSSELISLTSQEESLISKEAEFNSNMHSAEALIEQKKVTYLDNEKALTEIQTRFFTLEKELTEGEGKIALLKSDCENLKERIQRIDARNEELIAETGNINIQIQEAEDSLLKINTEISGFEQVLDDRNNTFAGLNNEITELEQSIDGTRRRLFNKAEDVSNIRNEISNILSIIEGLERKEARSIEEIESLKGGLSAIDVLINETRDRHINLDSGLKDKAENKERLLNEVTAKRTELSGLEENLYRDREELAAINSRLQSLMEIDKGKREDINGDIKVLCQVADMFECTPEYETAIEAALGEKLSALVVDDNNEIKKALRFIKENKIERSSFIPVEAVSIIEHSPSYNPSHSGVIGSAANFVKVKEGFEKTASLLLSNMVIVNDIETAFALWQDRAGSEHILFVTPEGEVFEPSGIVVAGTEKGVLRIKREIKEIGQAIEGKKDDIASTENKIADVRGSIASLDNEIAIISDEILSSQKEEHEVQVKIQSLEDERTRETKKLEYLSLELEADRKEKEAAKQTLDEKNSSSKSLEEEKQAIEDEIKNTQNTIADKKNALETMRIELTDIRLSITALREKIDSLLREKERLISSISDIENKKAGMQKERVEIENLIVQKENEIKIKEEFLQSSVITVADLQAKISGLREILEAKAAELSLLEKQQKTYILELEAVRKELTSVEIKKTEASMRLQHIKEDIRKSYGIEVEPSPEPSIDEALSEDELRLPELRDKLQEIGPVNLGTLEEFEELKARHEFLTRQQDDLIQSIATVQDTISKINTTTKKRLSEAFEALNEKFKEVFTILFGKGRAELLLTSEDILEAGIEIVAQPPGKKLQNLIALSGGERALTALSLLFAGFMIKPTPLCILDEADAPLDESNTDRFSNMLSGLAKNIQFITVTHNRRTMEAADYIYGVTMEEPGASKVISMHMAEAV